MGFKKVENKRLGEINGGKICFYFWIIPIFLLYKKLDSFLY